MSKKCLDRREDKNQPARRYLWKLPSSLMQLWPWHDHGVHCLEITSLSRVVWCRALPKCCSFACNRIQCKVCDLCSVLKVECSSGCSSLLHLESWSALRPHSSFSEYFPWISHEFSFWNGDKVFSEQNMGLNLLRKCFCKLNCTCWIFLCTFRCVTIAKGASHWIHYHLHWLICTAAAAEVFFEKFLQWNELQLRDRVLLLSRGAPTSLSPQLNWHSPKKIECRKNKLKELSL